MNNNLATNGSKILVIHKQINEWKKQQGISLAKGFLQSIVSLLKSLDIIESTKIKKDDLDVPLGLSGPIMSLFIKKKVEAVKWLHDTKKPGYKFEIIYRSGKTNVNADSLSKNPVIRENEDDP